VAGPKGGPAASFGIEKTEGQGKGMSQAERDAIMAREFQQRLEKKMRELELSQLEYWKAQLDLLLAARPEGVAALQSQIRKVADKMANRIQMLKKGA
jgi:hypothetical protein